MAQKTKIATLAIGSNDAPKEVKDSATAFTDADLRLQKAEQQIALWNRERELAIREMSTAEKEFTRAFEAWDPAKTKEKEVIS